MRFGFLMLCKIYGVNFFAGSIRIGELKKMKLKTVFLNYYDSILY